MNRKFLALLFFAFFACHAAIAQTGDSLGREVFVQPDSMRIYGSLLVPEHHFTGDAVLLIAGSGPTDRNGNQMAFRNNALRLLADSLAQHGIASLRYDKRFVGKSKGKINEWNLRFEDNVAVAKAFFQLLLQEKGVRRVFIAGHSEGATVGLLLAAEVKASGYISIAGPGFAADSLLRKQLATLPETLRAEAYQTLDTLKAGKLKQKTNPALSALFRPSIQPYLISWFRHNPQQLIGRLQMPVLIVQGTTDIQVSADHAEALAAACSKCTKVLVEGMNHVLKEAPAERAANINTYNQPSLPLAQGLIAAIVHFIKKN